MSENLGYLAGRKGIENTLFEKLGHAAESNGTPDPVILDELRKEYLFGKSNVLGTVSFYDFLKEENKGKKIYLCNGSACLTAGTQNGLREKLTKKFKSEEIGEMCCLGRCHENNAFFYNGKNYSGGAINNLEKIVGQQENITDRYAVFSTGTQFLTGSFKSTEEIKSVLNSCFKKSPEALLDELKLSGLRGRGGAGFSASFKLNACRQVKSISGTKFIVCNADEGDPGAYSDRYLLEHQPQLVLAGMVLAGYMAGANKGVIYIRAEYPESIERIREEVEHFYSAGLTGSEISGTGFTFDFKIIKAQGAYICGEETALLSSIEGQRPEVRVRPPYPAQSGLFNEPTVVNNVETLACIPIIFISGPETFSKTGTARSTGTKLISLDGFFHQPGIIEAEMGTPLQKVIEMAGGFKEPIKALHIGGPLGGIVPVSKLGDLTVDFESFSDNGFLLGHASIVCIPEKFPMIRYIEHLFRFTAHESCGKCFPCRIGSTRGAEMIEKSIKENYQIDRKLMEDLLETLESGSLCMLGGGLPLPIKNALQYFSTELDPYFKAE